ncbi:MAG: hypothetical protein ACLQVL_23605 [Terriglobia bacterium]
MGDLTKDLESAIAERLKEGSTAAEIAELLEPVMKSNLRAKYGRAFLWLIAGLDGAVVAIVVLLGLSLLKLDAKVVMTLVGATVVQTGSICYLIAAYLFPKS